MRPEIHPEYHPEARVVCACGNTFTVGATVPEITTEVCASCHPFFTGEQRIVDTAGQVERFMRRLEAGQEQREQERERRKQHKLAEREAKRQRRGLKPLRSQPAAPEQSREDDEDEAAEERPEAED
jgi:large subunit ribosomal protein L31